MEEAWRIKVAQADADRELQKESANMRKRWFIFPFVAGVVLAIAGINIVEQPIKTILLLLALCMAHEFDLRGRA